LRAAWPTFDRPLLADLTRTRVSAHPWVLPGASVGLRKADIEGENDPKLTFRKIAACNCYCFTLLQASL